ncbi:glycerophosphoryl diester phosphodiesterase [Nitrospira sp. KM1]|uniref:MlaD family protein n=1 Tax=Nitrospira sp. KM1 TaxID=1936990 RepID=UPI0013A7A1FD|nr:MlaD family protein [Nitrospira sp. KM1]BCA54556.1 glycerophosphoryl diester phosphodiesterase [Nitrospira sp. KM1]
MKQKAHFFKIGLFVTGAMSLALAAVIILGAGKWFEKKILVETYFSESVQGLEVGAPVRLRGVHVGRVEAIKLAREEYRIPLDMSGGMFPTKGLVIVRMSIRPSIAAYFPEIEEDKLMAMAVDAGFRFRLGSQGITGVLYIESEFLDPERYPPMTLAWKPNTPYIPSAPSTISELGADLRSITRQFEKIELDKIVSDLDVMITSVTQLVKHIESDQIITEAKHLIGELRGAVQETRHVLDNPHLRQALTDSAAAMQDFRKASADLSHTTKDVRQAMAQLPDVMVRLRKSMRGVDSFIMSKGESVDDLLDSLRSVSDELKYLTKSVEQYPSQVLFGEAPPKTHSVKR